MDEVLTEVSEALRESDLDREGEDDEVGDTDTEEADVVPVLETEQIRVLDAVPEALEDQEGEVDVEDETLDVNDMLWDNDRLAEEVALPMRVDEMVDEEDPVNESDTETVEVGDRVETVLLLDTECVGEEEVVMEVDCDKLAVDAERVDEGEEETLAVIDSDAVGEGEREVLPVGHEVPEKDNEAEEETDRVVCVVEYEEVGVNVSDAEGVWEHEWLRLVLADWLLVAEDVDEAE